MKLRLPYFWLVALVAAVSPSFLHAETVPISTWDDLKSAIAATDGAGMLENDLNITNSTGVVEIQAGLKLTLSGNGMSITSDQNIGDKVSSFNNAGELSLSQVTFDSNWAFSSVVESAQPNSTSAQGGAIFNTGKLTVAENSQFLKNTAAVKATANANGSGSGNGNIKAHAYGGAIYNSSQETALISNVMFSGNSATAVTFAEGWNNRSIWDDGEILMRGYAYGGAIYNVGGMTISLSTFDGNSALSSTNFAYALAQGGAIYNAASSGKMNISNSIFKNNYVSAIAGYVVGAGSIIDRVPAEDRPHAEGGAIYNASTVDKNGNVIAVASLIVSGSLFEGNYTTVESDFAHSAGGAIYNTGNAEITGTDFRANYATATAKAFVSAGAIYNGKTGELTVSSSNFIGNFVFSEVSNAGAGAINNEGGMLVISESLFDGNYASANASTGATGAQAGAIHNQYGKVALSVSRTNFIGNYASANMNNTDSSANGGAILNAGGSAIFSNCLFEGNFVSANNLVFGGAINNDGELTIASNRFVGNYAAASASNGSSRAEGGTIYNTGAKLDISQTSFTGNHAFASSLVFGGVIHHAGNALNISGSLFDGNYASANANALGGVIYNLGNLSIGGSVFEGNYVAATAASNSSVARGGAIVNDRGVMNIANSLFKGNYATLNADNATSAAQGGAIFNAGTLTLTNCSFENNYTMQSPNSFGGAIYHAFGTLTIVANGQDCVFRGNLQNVTSVDDGGRPTDGHSNAVFIGGGMFELNVSNGGNIIFYDNIAADKKRNVYIDSNGGPHDGSVIFKEGVTIENLNVFLRSGTMQLENNTTIQGDVYARTGTILHISGFTKLEGDYHVLSIDNDGPHTVYISMNDEMIANYSEDNPVWDFNDGQSTIRNLYGEKLDFVLDLKDVKLPIEKLRPYIFSHYGQTEELMENVRNANSVTLVDGDAWSYTMPRIYTDGDRTLDLFDFLSGQFGNLPEGVAPEGVGNAQVETLWTTVRSLWSFADNARSQDKMRLNRESNTAIWISGIGNYFTQENQPNVPGYRYQSWGTSLGGEYALSPKWAVGAAIGELFGKHNINDSLGRVDKDAFVSLLYLNRDIELNKTNRLAVNLQAGYENSRNKGSVKISRFVNDELYGKWRDQAWMLDLRAIWRRQLNEKTMMETYAGLQYTDATQGDTTIRGDKYSYHLYDGKMNDFRATIGMGILRHSYIGEHAVNYYARAGVIQDIDRRVPHVRVRGELRSWTSQGSKPGRTALNFNTGASVQIANHWSVGTDYLLEAANKSLMQTGRLSLMYEF